MRIPFLSGFILFCFLSSGICSAQNIELLPAFTKDDRVLILAPHPDDETIATAGVIQEARAAGAKVKVVCYTNGDNNELAFIVYEKRLVFKKNEFLHMGEVRTKETIAAMSFLELGADNLIFLGYPDFGTMDILAKYWGKAKPFKSMLTRVRQVPYAKALSFGVSYTGENILKDIKTVLTDFRPTKIFVSHPADTNRDHQSLYLFLRIALWDLAGKIETPQIFPYLIHVIGWPKPRGYHPDLVMVPPEELKTLAWYTLPLSEQSVTAKHNTIVYYKSQILCDPPYLFSFARRNEIFSDLPALVLKKQTGPQIVWQSLDSGENVFDAVTQENKKQEPPALFYACLNDHLMIKINLKRKIDKDLGILVFLFGHNPQKDFARLPKLSLSVDTLGLHVKDKKQTLFIGDIRMKYQGKSVILEIPLWRLGNPRHILASVRTRVDDLSLSERAWRVIEVE